MEPTGIALTDEELAAALARRQRRPFTEEEFQDVMRLRSWFLDQEANLEKARLRRERWQKLFPIIFTATSTMVGLATAIYTFFIKSTGKAP